MMTAWVDIADVIQYLGEDAPTEGDAEGQQRLENAITSASELLYSLSGRKFPGELTAVVTPRPMRMGDYLSAPVGNHWPNSTWGLCHGVPHHRCEATASIGLGRSPLVSIQKVVIDEEVIDPSTYRIDDQKWLTRIDCRVWPLRGCTCSDFIIDFTFGENPPQLGTDAALILSAEMYRAMTPGTTCRLPARLTSITRQGISMAVIDPMDFMDKGLTGVYQIDMFLQAYNPGRHIRKPTVYSPDVPNVGHQQTWPEINPLRSHGNPKRP
jgi:hypothetical protein